MASNGACINNNKISNSINKSELLDLFYPIGSIYTSMNNTNPSALFGGTWTQIVDEFLYCTSSSNKTGGANSISYTPTGTVASHNHTFNGNAGVAFDIASAGNIKVNYTHYNSVRWQSNWNASISLSGHSTTATNMYDCLDLVGNTDNTAPKFTGTAATISTMPKYRTCYAWYRTA